MARKWQLALFIIVIILGLTRFLTELAKPPSITGPVIITATLDSEPKRSGASQVFRLGQMVVIARTYPEVHYGDRVKLEGELQTDRTIKFPKLTILAKGQPPSKLKADIFRIRELSFDIFARSLPEPQASTLAGMVLGIDRIPTDFVVDLRKSGLIHLVVVSGQNITLLAGFVMLLAGIIKRRMAIILTFATIAVYTLLAGAEPPAVRAALMGSFAYFGQFIGRQTVGILLLFWASLLMFLYEPGIIFNLSFILSFSATLGILVFGPYFRLIFAKPRILSESMSVTVTAWLMTLPVLVAAFSQASVVSVVANILVSFVVLPIMILGFLMLGAGLILPFFAQIIGWIVYLPLTYLVAVAGSFAKLPFAQIIIEKPLTIVIVGYYLLLIVILVWLRKVGSTKLS